MELIDAFCNKLGLDELEKIGFLKSFSDKIGMKVSHLSLLIVALLSFLVVFEYGSTFIVFTIGFLYPAYMSFKAVESRDNIKDDRRWLTYWLVFGFVHVFDDFFGIILSFVPFYNMFKILFYIWMFHPRSEGAIFVYEKFIKGLLAKYENEIDSKLQKIKQKVDEAKPILESATRALKREGTEKLKDD